MKIAVVTGAGESLLPGILLSRLRKEGLPAECVLRPRAGALRAIRDGLARATRRGLACRIRERLRPSPVMSRIGVTTYREYASAHGLEGWDRPLARIMADLDVELVTFEDLNDNRTAAAIRDRGIDLLLNTCSSLYREVLDAPRIGVLNPHMGPLPRVRGVNAMEWSLFLGLPTGITVHRIDRGVDTGDVLLFEPFEPKPGEDIPALRGRTGPLMVEALVRGARKLADGGAGEPQAKSDGRQYFVMHPRLVKLAERRIGG